MTREAMKDGKREKRREKWAVVEIWQGWKRGKRIRKRKERKEYNRIEENRKEGGTIIKSLAK